MTIHEVNERFNQIIGNQDEKLEKLYDETNVPLDISKELTIILNFWRNQFKETYRLYQEQKEMMSL